MRLHAARLTVPTLLLLAAVSACTPPESAPVTSGANPYPQPPPVRTEVIPKPPVSEDPLIWQPGHWDWAGTGFSWHAGEWMKRAGHGTEWQDGYWSNQNGTWSWVPAHWM
ncbi:MAG: hypothetical protein M0Z28_00725 [Rhodospirillales bacterium]|nr:hypothetical protein [Rhodospirillales bacterium]